MRFKMTIFNPMTQKISESERLRIKHGKLIKEDNSVRNRTNWINRLFTRGQYDQAAILKKMKSIYDKTLKGKEPTSETFIQNYDLILKKVESNNLRYEKSCLSFFFKTDIKAHKNALEEMKASIVKSPNKPVVTSAWWGAAASNEKVLETIEFFDELQCYYPYKLVELINSDLKMAKGKEESAQCFELLLETLGLATIKDFMDKQLTTREKFHAYLAANKENFTTMIEDLIQ